VLELVDPRCAWLCVLINGVFGVGPDTLGLWQNNTDTAGPGVPDVPYKSHVQGVSPHLDIRIYPQSR